MTAHANDDRFPYTLQDIVGWVIKRYDGTIIEHRLVTADQVAKQAGSSTSVALFKPGGYNHNVQTRYSHYSQWCNHEPHPEKGMSPIFEADGIGLWVGDNPGARKCFKEFDICVDGGNVLDVPGEHDLPVIYGDPDLKRKLDAYLTERPKKYTPQPGETRILKLRWYDRDKPPVEPVFWAELLAELKKARDKGKFNQDNPLRVMTICQGGHGRSGSAAACLMMMMSDYTPLDALTHIRAMHCARAIESKVQHEYLNLVATYLGREPNALEAEKVPNFKDRLLGMTSEYAKRAQALLKVNKSAGATVEERGGTFI